MKSALVSIIVATIALPAIAARYRDPVRGAKRMVLFLLVFTLLYVAFLTLVHATYGEPAQPR